MLVAGLAACDDIASKTSAPRPTVAAVEPPKPAPVPAPLPVVTPPPETKKDTIVVDKVDEDVLPSDPLAAARKLLADGEDSKALKQAKLAVARTPNRSGAWNTLGRVQLQMGRRKEALESFEKAIELNPENSYAHNNAGLALIYSKQYDEAVEELQQAVELKPVEGYMWNNLGMAYEQLDRLEEAREAYGKAAEMDSDKAKESMARLEGVKSVVRTAKVDSQTTDGKRETSSTQ
ncbi:MAG TPA: tetratricopeptide repeat protein [Polyangia bacterium]|jgi:Flp pilus assembly protein TadD|nr:tetratricopeptide repeat protein [Polyangia bacterium]